MTKYITSFTPVIAFIFIFFAITIEARCGKEGRVEFFPEFNQDNLYGVITFTEIESDKVVIDGIFSTITGGVDGIKTKDGKPRYTAELYSNDGVRLHDLTAPIFHNAIELVSFNKQYAKLQICNETNSIIGKVVVIKRDGSEIARTDIYEILP